MLIGAVIVAFVLGIVAGGSPANLGRVQLRWAGLLFLAVLVRYGTEAAIRAGASPADALRLPLFGGAFVVLGVGLWLNRDRPGLLVAGVGVAANGLAIVANGGWMPVWRPAMELVGLQTTDLVASFHRVLPETMNTDFLLRAGPLGDLLPIPLPFLTNVSSIGDVFIAGGLGWFVFATLVYPYRAGSHHGQAYGTDEHDTGANGEIAASPGPGAHAPRLFHPLVRAATGLAPRAPYVDTALLDRPVVLGGGAAALPAPPGALSTSAIAIPTDRRWALRLARHAYVRLALDARFSALWLGQLISLLGDRLHQVALAVLVLSVTGSAVDVGITFVAATLPNLLFGPIAGTLVDRWDQKRVLVASDLLRAGLVVLLPFAAARDIHLVYPVVFAVTTVSIFFRPARAAVLPRIVRSEDLTAANSATWTAETIADIAGYPIAGLIVAFLGSALAIAFWFDAASYIVSGLLILSVTIPPVLRSAAPAAGSAARGLARELMEGWRLLRGDSRLFANTLVSAVAQLSAGAEIALAVVYARQVLDGRFIGYPQNYASIDMAIGIGNLVGGIVIGAVGARWRKGPLIIGGYIVVGAGTALMGLTGNVLVALAAVTAAGVANMVAIIPTQTLFQERTPPELMGRVVGIRFSIVFGVMTAAMAISGILAEAVGPGTVLVTFGALTALAGLAGALIPAVRGS